MNSIDICYSPELIGLYSLKEKIVVVVDILRATSCITTGIAHGVKSITPFESLEACIAMKEKGYYIAGERGGQKVEGFDIGNSPFSYMEEYLIGEKIAITTTNGTVAIEKSKEASKIVIGSFLNISAIASYLIRQKSDVLFFCAGWKGRISLEDTLFAGALTNMLESDFDFDDDSVMMAHSLYVKEENNILKTIQNSSHAKRLKKFDVTKDIEFCLTRDKYNVVPIVIGDEIVAF